MDILILLVISRLFNLNRKKLFIHYIFVALLGGFAYFMYLHNADSALSQALLDTAVAFYIIFIIRIIMGTYKKKDKPETLI